MPSMKKCPRCAEEVRLDAKICRFCNYAFQEEDTKSAKADVAKTGRMVGIGLALILGVWFCSSVSQRRPAHDTMEAGEAALPFAETEPGLLDVSQLTPVKVEASMSAYCADRYPADYSMRAACERNAADGAADFGKIWNRHLDDSSMLQALSGCHERYTTAKITDWSMAGACARNNEEGYAQVNR